jgi:hypothetical protein
MSTPKKCEKILKSGKQCSRNAQFNSDYCWQHISEVSTLVSEMKTPTKTRSTQKSTFHDDTKIIETNEISSGNLPLMLQSLQPGVMSNVIRYAGTLGNFSKTFSEVNQKNALKNWFMEINVRTPFSEVTDREIPLLWGLYQKRIANAPARDLLKKAIAEGLNPDYFAARIISYNNLIRGIPQTFINSINLDLNLINDDLKDFLDVSKIREGDLIFLEKYKNYISGAYLIYDGSKLISLDYEFIGIDNPILPKEIIINDFPTTNYFSDTISRVVNFDTTDTQVQLVKEYQGTIYDTHDYKIYQYITTGKFAGYEIWTYTPLTDANFKGILVFDGANAGQDLGEDFIEFIGNLIDTEEVMDEIYEKIVKSQNLRMLFQNEIARY